MGPQNGKGSKKKPPTAGRPVENEKEPVKSRPGLSSRGKNGYDKILIVISAVYGRGTEEGKRKTPKRKNENYKKKIKGAFRFFKNIIMTMFFLLLLLKLQTAGAAACAF